MDKVRAYIEKHHDRPIRLDELGRLVELSPFTIQRNFKREMGVSPLSYQRALRAGRLRGALKQGGSVTQAVYEAGFGSPSRASEGAALGMTPTQFARGGKGESIGWCSAQTEFGWVMAGATARGLCWLSLAGSEQEAEADLRREFPAATLRRDPSLAVWIETALASVAQSFSLDRKQAGTKSLDLRGTVFQLRVWQALRQIPAGETRTYSQLAKEMGESRATRAVARACAMNRVALLVPCHRVIGADGSLTGYRWGIERKKVLLTVERQAAES
ncbi:MAG: bifunctional transcriptional activator/DNA repair enzyme AdaA [Acidobacteriota bacterium]